MKRASRFREFLRYLPFLFRGRKIVLRRLSGGLGDNLMLSMLAREAKKAFPGTAVIVETERPELFRDNPNVDLVLQGKVALSYVKPKYLLDDTTTVHVLDQLIQATGLDIETWERRLDLFLDEGRYQELGEKLPDEFIAVCAQGKATFAANRKEWGVENFQRLVNLMPRETFVQIGLPSDEMLQGVTDLRGLDVLSTAFVLKRAKTAVVLEGAWGHVSNAVGARAVVIFGGALNPDVISYPTNLAVVAQPGCGPCFLSAGGMSACPTMECMSRISPEFVRDLLAEKRFLTGGVVDVADCRHGDE